jgi:hypothetical protein
MHHDRPIRFLLRAALAVIFGLMSVAHGPVMTFAKTQPDAGHHAMSASKHPSAHHHSASPDEPSARSMPDAAPVCYAFGCFVALAIGVGAPAGSFEAIGTLLPNAPDAMVPVYLDPADPPPRLPV